MGVIFLLVLVFIKGMMPQNSYKNILTNNAAFFFKKRGGEHIWLLEALISGGKEREKRCLPL